MPESRTKIFGTLCLLFGFAGLVLILRKGDSGFGVLSVFLANIAILLLTGVMSWLAGFLGHQVSRVFLLLSGIGYGLLSFFSFVSQETASVSWKDVWEAWFYMAIAAVAVFLGTSQEEEPISTRRTAC